MTRVVAVRHGETDWNRELRVQGWAAAPLNERGREQARALGRHLAASYDFDRLLASDLRRTRETTVRLREAGSMPEPEYTRGWRERCFGVFQGLDYEEVFGRFPEHDASLGMVGLESTPERGESLLETRERVLGAWEDLLATANQDDDVLIVTHGGPLYILLAHARGEPLPAALAEFAQDNCAVNEFRVGSDVEELTVHRENDVRYRTAAVEH